MPASWSTAAIGSRASRRSISFFTLRMWSWSQPSRGQRTDDGGQRARDNTVLQFFIRLLSSVLRPLFLIPPPLAPHLLADGAGDARRTALRRDDAALGGAAGDFQHELGADRFLELVALVDRDDE